MRIAIISDIHGNLDAFSAVLHDMAGTRIDETVCLGDNIGYGPQPEEVLDRIRDLRIPSVCGNHELAARKPVLLERFNPLARRSLVKTIGMLSPQALAFAATFPLFLVRHNARFVHGFPPGSATTYLFQVSDAKLLTCFRRMQEPIAFVGHTHLLEVLAYDGKTVTQTIPHQTLTLDAQLRYIINAGSVGQPRDGDNRAKYLIWDTESAILEFHAVPYDIQAVVDKILKAGLPERHAHRLW